MLCTLCGIGPTVTVINICLDCERMKTTKAMCLIMLWVVLMILINFKFVVKLSKDYFPRQHLPVDIYSHEETFRLRGLRTALKFSH